MQVSSGNELHESIYLLMVQVTIRKARVLCVSKEYHIQKRDFKYTVKLSKIFNKCHKKIVGTNKLNSYLFCTWPQKLVREGSTN